jgi:hypothetical protein
MNKAVVQICTLCWLVLLLSIVNFFPKMFYNLYFSFIKFISP